MSLPAPQTGTVQTNGIDLYYEIHGAGGGTPLVLAHGGLGTIPMIFGALLPQLAATRQVIALELHGHGHSALGQRAMSYAAMGDDIAALIAHLKLEQADVLGFSLGGGAALQAAVRHPAQVRRLVLISAPCKRDGWYPEVLEGIRGLNTDIALMMMSEPIYQFYADVAPVPDDWPRLVTSVAATVTGDYDWSEQVAHLPMPTLLIYGDADSISPAHAAEFFGLLGGGKADGGYAGRPASQLAILPGTDHLQMTERTDLLVPVLLPFLDADQPPAL